MSACRHELTTFAVAALALFTGSAAAQPPKVLTTTFFGGVEDESVSAVRIASDGSVVAAVGTYERVVMGTSTRWQWRSSWLVRLSRDLDRELWRQPLPESVAALAIDARDDVYVLGARRLTKVKLADGAAVGETAAFASQAEDLSVNPDGTVAVLAGARALRFGADLQPRGEVVHGIQSAYAVMLDRDGGVFVGGDSNPGTGCEPYRVPAIRHFKASGDRDWRFYDYPGQLARLEGSGFESDSSIRGLVADPRGRLWFRGWSDGLNTMLRQKVWNPKERNPFIDGACFPGVCPYPRGARTYMMVGRLLDTYNEVGAATWWQAAGPRPTDFGGKATEEGFETWLSKFPLCGCRPHPYATSTSTFIEGVGFHGPQVAIWGSSDKYIAASPDAWWGNVVDSGSVFVGLLDDTLEKGRFGAAIPGSTRVGGPPAGDLRGGRLVVAAAASDKFPAAAAGLQPRFGGGTLDGFFVLACIDSDAACAGPLPPLPVAAPPVVRPEPALPTLSRCSKDAAGKVVSARITAGMLPDFGVDYSAAMTGSAAGDAGAPDGGRDAGPSGPDTGTSPSTAPTGAPGPDAGGASVPDEPPSSEGRDAEPGGCSCAVGAAGRSDLRGGGAFGLVLAVALARGRPRRLARS